MEYVLHLYMSLQPVDGEEVILTNELPELSNHLKWFGGSAILTEEEYIKYFPTGYQTPAGMGKLLKDLYTTRRVTTVE